MAIWLACAAEMPEALRSMEADAPDVDLVGDAAGDDVGGELCLVDLGGAGEKVVRSAVPAEPPRLRAKLERRGDLVGFGAGDADVVEGGDGDEDEGEADDLEGAPEGDLAEGGVEREAGEVEEAGGDGDVADRDHEAGVEFTE